MASEIQQSVVMLKLGNKIRRTRREHDNFDNLTGLGAYPVTIQEHDQALESAAQAWEQEGVATGLKAEGDLLAILCRDAKLAGA